MSVADVRRVSTQEPRAAARRRGRHVPALAARPVPHLAVIAGLMLSVTLPGGTRASDAADSRFAPSASPLVGASATATYASYVKQSRPLQRLVRLVLADDRPMLGRPAAGRTAPVPQQLAAAWSEPDATARLRAPPPTR